MIGSGTIGAGAKSATRVGLRKAVNKVRTKLEELDVAQLPGGGISNGVVQFIRDIPAVNLSAQVLQLCSTIRRCMEQWSGRLGGAQCR